MTAPPILRYPIKKLTDSDDYIKIDIYEYQPGGLPTEQSFATQSGGVRGSIKQSIILPMTESTPSNNLSAAWGEGKLGPMQAAGFDIATSMINSGFSGLFGAGAEQIRKLSEAAGTGVGQQAFSSELARKALGTVLGQDPGSILSRTGGIVFNENVELLFGGVTLRKPFSFVFTMTPRSAQETATIKNIILSLKKAMTPSRGAVSGGAAGLFITAPNVFKIAYKSGNNDHPFLNRFKVCALLDLDVDFTPDGTYATYRDATPIHTRLSLTFQELTPIYRKDYDEDEGLIGTGY
jgi:hypothetical protein